MDAFVRPLTSLSHMLFRIVVLVAVDAIANYTPKKRSDTLCFLPRTGLSRVDERATTEGKEKKWQ